MSDPSTGWSYKKSLFLFLLNVTACHKMAVRPPPPPQQVFQQADYFAIGYIYNGWDVLYERDH